MTFGLVINFGYAG